MIDPYANSLEIQLPNWLSEYRASYQISESLSERMKFVIAASQRNINKDTGGPFAAGVFETESGKLISLGVNLVTSQGLSILHAEILAISLAQQQLGSYELAKSEHRLELLTSTEPCAMCLGAIPWSGIHRVVCAATGKDAEAIGFDEGDKPNAWKAGLEKRKIEVITGVCRDEAKAVLNSYANKNGHIY